MTRAKIEEKNTAIRLKTEEMAVLQAKITSKGDAITQLDSTNESLLRKAITSTAKLLESPPETNVSTLISATDSGAAFIQGQIELITQKRDQFFTLLNHEPIIKVKSLLRAVKKVLESNSDIPKSTIVQLVNEAAVKDTPDSEATGFDLLLSLLKISNYNDIKGDTKKKETLLTAINEKIDEITAAIEEDAKFFTPYHETLELLKSTHRELKQNSSEKDLSTAAIEGFKEAIVQLNADIIVLREEIHQLEAQAERERLAAEQAAQAEHERPADDEQGARAEERERVAAAQATQAERDRLAAEALAALDLEEDFADLDDDAEIAYALVVSKLEALKAQPYPVDTDETITHKKADARKEVDTRIDELLAQATSLKNEGKVRTPELTKALESTYSHLTGQLSPEAYQAVVNSVQGKPSTGLKVLGGIMLALCVAVAVLGVVFFPPLLGAAAALSLTGTAATVTTGTAIGGTSLLLGAGGLSFFAKGTQKDLSAAMSNAAEQAYKDKVTYTAVTPAA